MAKETDTHIKFNNIPSFSFWTPKFLSLKFKLKLLVSELESVTDGQAETINYITWNVCIFYIDVSRQTEIKEQQQILVSWISYRAR